MANDKKRTKSGAEFTKNKKGDAVYDLRDSTNILRDMNRAIIQETKKSGSSEGATQWFIDKINSGLMIVPEDHELVSSLFKNRSRAVSRMFFELPGRMFTFLYRPVGMAKLEYYDISPLIITLPTEKTGEEETDTVLGLNLHYLEPDIRAELIDRMLKLSTRRFGEKPPPKGVGYFHQTYEMMKSIRYVYGLPCLRSYRIDRIIGKPILIPSNEWGNAVALPTESFVKAKSNRVWVESRIKIREFIRSLADMGE